MTDLSSAFAARMMKLGDAEFNEGDYEQVARLLFDYVACAYSGSQQSSASALRRWAKPYSGSARSSIIGGGRMRTPAPIAALVNGTTAHSYELDDTHDSTLSHPGSVIISAALAVAAETGSSGRRFIASIIAGYEAMARIGLAANAGEVIEFGFHPTAVFGGFGAATTAAILKDLSRETLLSAWGHALSMASGSMQFSDEATGTAIKRLHAGYAAQQGVLAVELAEAGLEAPQRALDGKYSFFKLYARAPRMSRLDVDGSRLAIHDISFKPYACCRQFHSVIDGLREVTNNFRDNAKIRSIVVRGPRVLGEQHMLMRPTSSMAAQYSLPFVVGATLEFGPANYGAFAPENLDNSAILHWADLLAIEFDADIQTQYPEHFGSEVEIGLADGTVRKERVLDSQGTPARPFSWKALRDKAENLTSALRPSLELDALWKIVLGMRSETNIHAFEDMLDVEIQS
jgi:2-methylcitrate dehydratase PrpD